jgi:hypothetical protein
MISLCSLHSFIASQSEKIRPRDSLSHIPKDLVVVSLQAVAEDQS